MATNTKPFRMVYFKISHTQKVLISERGLKMSSRGLYALLGHSRTAIFRMAIRTFEISRNFKVACSEDPKIGSSRLEKREVQMWEIGLADRRKSG